MPRRNCTDDEAALHDAVGKMVPILRMYRSFGKTQQAIPAAHAVYAPASALVAPHVRAGTMPAALLKRLTDAGYVLPQPPESETR